MKKIIALLLAAVMVLGLFAACGNNDTPGTTAGTNTPDTPDTTAAVEEKHDPVTLHYYIAGFADQEDADKVYSEVNKLIQAIYPWITVEFHVSNSADFPTHFALAQTNEDPIDIVGSFGLSYQNEISNGSFMDVTEYLGNYEGLASALPEWAYEYGKKDGKTYGFPNWQQCNYSNFALAVEKQYADKYGFDVEKVNQLIQAEEFFNPAVYDEIGNFLAAAKDGGEKVAFAGHYITCQSRGYENLTGPIYFAISDEACKLVNLWETQQMKDYLVAVNKYQDAGYIPEDFATNSGAYTAKGAVENGYCTFYYAGNAYVPNFPTLRLNGWGQDLYFLQTLMSEEQYYVGMSYAAGLTSVSATSKHPEDALRVIELLYTDAEIQNMLVYGLEGEHYTKNADGTITTLEYSSGQADGKSSYGMYKFSIGNSGLTWINQSFDQDFYDWAFNDMPENAVVSKLIGFAPDTTEISTKLGQVNAIVKEYSSQLLNATAPDWEATYAEFIDKLDAAGIDDVIAALQSQVDDFLASK